MQPANLPHARLQPRYDSIEILDFVDTQCIGFVEPQDNGVRITIAETNALVDEVDGVMEATGGADAVKRDRSMMAGLMALNEFAVRNRRVLMAYHERRARKIEQIRWDYGATLPSGTKSRLGAGELDYFRQYNRILAQYVRDSGIDVTVDSCAPVGEPRIKVRALCDLTDVVVGGIPKSYVKGQSAVVFRRDVEHLVRQGKMAQEDVAS